MSKKIFMSRKTVQGETTEEKNRRNILSTDAALLGALLYNAFHGSVDDEGESPEDANGEAIRTLTGYYGKVNEEASFVYEDSRRFVSCCLVCEWPKLEIPLLAFSATIPEFRQQGLASALIMASMNVLLKQGYPAVALFVSMDNLPAINLYKKIGFQVDNFKLSE